MIYKTSEAIKMLEENPGLIFQEAIGSRSIPKFLEAIEHNGQGYKLIIRNEEGYSDIVFVDTRWRLLENPVTFMEAIKSGKLIRYENWKNHLTLTEVFLFLSATPTDLQIKIITGKWFIKEVGY